MDLLGQLAGFRKKPELPVATPTVPQPPTALEQRQRVLAQAAVANDSIVYRGCGVFGIAGSSTDLKLTSNSQDTSHVAPV